MNEPSTQELLGVALQAARAAGPDLLRRFGGVAEGIERKSSSTDEASEADREAERTIRAVLARLRPDDALMGEEGEDEPGTTGLRWVVDPLDGTTNYLFGIPQWCVSVACEGRAGVVLDPVRGEEWAIAAGSEPTFAGAPIRRQPLADDLSRALVATGFGYDSARRALQARSLLRVVPAVRDIRRAGAAALDLAWTAAGRIDCYYERGINPWDIAAGTLLCEAVGLEVRTLPADGEAPEGVLVAPPTLADELQELIGA